MRRDQNAYNENMEKKFDGLELILFGCFLILFAGFFLTKLKLDDTENAAASNEKKVSGGMEALVSEDSVLREQEMFRNTEMNQNKGAQKADAKSDTAASEQKAASDEKNRAADAKEETDQDISAGDVPDSTAAAGMTGEEPRIRVLIKTTGFSGYYHEKLVLKGNSPLHLNGDTYVAGAQEAVEITGDSQWFQEGCIKVAPENTEAGISVENLKRAQGVPVYEGVLEIYQGSGGLVLVNELPLETYLKYVVPSEMPASYAAEALKAQAVCARTYAYRQILNESLSDYHAQVDDSVSYQVYNNTVRQPSADQAVDATTGKILTCEGEPITAYFFSTSSGHTSTDEVWDESSDEAYLASVYLGEEEAPDISTEEAFAAFITSRDENSYEAEDGWYRWQVTLPIEYLNSRIEKFGIGTLNSLEIVRRSDGGAVENLTVHGSAGDQTLSGEYEIREVFSTKGYPVQKNDGKTTTEMSLMPSAYFICSPVVQENVLTGYLFQGGGYGHGVGMSQNGAAHMAENGKTYEEILHFFYANVELTDIRK